MARNLPVVRSGMHVKDRCPKYPENCGAAWTCPCGEVLHHQQYCHKCGLGWCALCHGAGIILDDGYTWYNPRVVRCPACSAETEGMT